MSQVPARQMTRGEYAYFTERRVSSVDGKTPATGYASGDVLTGKVWAGEDGAVLATPVCGWVDASQAKFFIKFETGAVALEPAVYCMQVYCAKTVDDEVRKSTIFDGTLEVLPSPGEASPLPVYISGRDLEDYCPSIRNYFNPKVHMTGFAEQRAMAREWFDDLLHKHFRGSAGIVSRIYPSDYQYQYVGRSPQLVKWLADGSLVITRAVKEMQALRTCHVIFQGLVPTNPDLYTRLAQQYKADADRACRLVVAELRTGGTMEGGPLAIIDLSTVPVLRG